MAEVKIQVYEFSEDVKQDFCLGSNRGSRNSRIKPSVMQIESRDKGGNLSITGDEVTEVNEQLLCCRA